MTVSVAAPPPTRTLARPNVGLPTIYAGGLLVWIVTRWLMLVHQGAWPWMNAFVVAAARGIVVGDWNEAVRPQLPAVLGVPLVLAGATEQQAVAGLYVLASLVQFGAFLALLRALFPGHLQYQTLGLALFLLFPYNHSIHHYRDVPVVLASSGVFLLAALWVARSHNVLWILGATLLGIWSRTEVVTFVAVLVVLGLLVWRRAAVRLASVFALAAVVALVGLAAINRAEGIDPTPYQVHTFLDSTPESWLSPACQADPTENCRAAEGLRYFGPEASVVSMVLAHPVTALIKTARSAFDNLWILLGPNLSTLPASLPFVIVSVSAWPAVRQVLGQVSAGAWMVGVAILGETVLPPLSWAPPHPQYHLQLVAAAMIVLVPILATLARTPRGRLVSGAFLLGNAALSAFRYTRYPGY